MNDDLLPLFPLEIVLLPEETLPLHIFEERYKTMITECLEAKARGTSQQEFGVVLLKGQALRYLGCTARIVNLTRRYDDGRMDIVTVGDRRFEIQRTNEERPCLRGAVDYFEDEGAEASSEAAAKLAIESFREVKKKLRRAEEFPAHLTRPYRHLSFHLGAALPLDLEFKQRLLALRREPDRLTLIQFALEAYLTQLDRAANVQQKAGGNGHAR